jgi:putative endonuclease
MARHNDLGKKGEDAAAEYLLKLGHQILERGYRFGRAEVDIISIEKNMVVFTEVKTRSSEYFGYPEDAVDKKKKKLLLHAAEEFVVSHKLDLAMRFDIISVLSENENLKIFHIPDVFLGSMGDTGIGDE